MRTTAILSLLMCAGVGCSDDEPERPHLPLFVDGGGPKLTHPEVVVISYNNDVVPYLLLDQMRQLVVSPWLDAVGAEYGIGAGSVVASVVKPEDAPTVIDDAGIVDALFAGLADNSLAMPTPNTLYMFFFPEMTRVMAFGASSCTDFLGYHDSARRDGVEVAYAVIAACPDDGTLADRQLTMSHELIEAATDPLPLTNPGWQLRDPATPWRSMGEEVADLCVRGDASGLNEQQNAQRSWSNAAAAADQDPCVPHRYGASYFNVVADTRTLLRIPPGGHETIHLEGFASEDVLNWLVSAEPAKENSATLTLGGTGLAPGVSMTLDIALPSSTPASSRLTMYVFSQRGTDAKFQYNYLPVPVFAGDPCSSIVGCLACASQAGCGYCASSGRCESIGASGSAESSCKGADFRTWPGSCDGFCASHGQSCNDCTARDGCGWCQGATPGCMEASHDLTRPENQECAYADWSIKSSYCPVTGP